MSEQGGATVIGGDVLAANIVKFTEGFLEQVNEDMAAARDVLAGRIRRNISLTDHSLSDLRDLGHPYSRKAPGSLHQPQYLVHSQSGRMVAGMISGTTPASVSGRKLVAEAWAGVGDEVEHAAFVELGTSKMVPRPFLSGSLKEVQGDILNTLSRSLKNTTINFNGRKVKL